jgi:hypothetical protein
MKVPQNAISRLRFAIRIVRDQSVFSPLTMERVRDIARINLSGKCPAEHGTPGAKWSKSTEAALNLLTEKGFRPGIRRPFPKSATSINR